jgi:hypothetical protein
MGTVLTNGNETNAFTLELGWRYIFKKPGRVDVKS